MAGVFMQKNACPVGQAYGVFLNKQRDARTCVPFYARNQKLATSLDLSWSWSLSAMRAMNSEFVGFPLVLLTV